MDRKTFAIGVMCVTALLLAIINLMPTPAAAGDSIKERDFTVVTSHITSGGDGLYIVDNRTGIMACFTWDPTSRSLKARDLKPIADAFRD